MTVKNAARDVSPPVPPRPVKPSFFLPQEENKPNLLSKFLQNNRQFSQDTRELTEESGKIFLTVEHINQSISSLAARTPASNQTSRANIQDKIVWSNPQSPEDSLVPREQENNFNQFASIQQPTIPLKQAASLFPVEANDNQRELIHSSIGELQQFTNSKLMATPNTPLSQTTGAAVRPKKISFIPLNSKTEGQNMQCFAFDFQNKLQHNSSADEKKTNQTSNAFRENEEKLQTQCHSEKGRKTMTKVTGLNPQTFENCSRIPLQFDTGYCQIAKECDFQLLKVLNNTVNFSNQSKSE